MKFPPDSFLSVYWCFWYIYMIYLFLTFQNKIKVFWCWAFFSKDVSFTFFLDNYYFWISLSGKKKSCRIPENTSNCIKWQEILSNALKIVWVRLDRQKIYWWGHIYKTKFLGSSVTSLSPKTVCKLPQNTTMARNADKCFKYCMRKFIWTRNLIPRSDL